MLYCLYVLPTLNKAYLIWFDLIWNKWKRNIIFGRPTFGQPQMIPLLYQHHLCRDRCINIYQTEIFQFAGEIVYSVVNSQTNKNRRTQLSRGFTYANLKFGNILLFEAKTIGYFEIVIRWTYVPWIVEKLCIFLMFQDDI